VNDWKIARKGSACAGCQAEFRPGTVFISAIYESEPGAESTFDRVDTCPECFEKEERAPFSRWFTTHPKKVTDQPLLDLDMARDFLLRLAREGNPERHTLMFILALLLMRKRKVKLVEQRTEGDRPVMEFLLPLADGEETIVIPSVHPSEEETGGIEKELGRLFGLVPAPVHDGELPVAGDPRDLGAHDGEEEEGSDGIPD
jgi:hypothetical protein